MTCEDFMKILDDSQPGTNNKFFMVYDSKNKSMLTASVRDNGKGTFVDYNQAFEYINKNKLVFSGTTGVKLKLPMFKLKKEEVKS